MMAGLRQLLWPEDESHPQLAALQAQLFRRLLVERHLAVPEPVQEHLLRHLPRTPAALRLAAARLDRAAFSARAQITRPLAAAALAGLLDADEDDTSMTDAPAPSRPDRRVV